MCDGCKSLNVRAKQLLEEFGLGFTELRELGCNVCDRTVVLAEFGTYALVFN